MKAIVAHKYGSPEEMTLEELATPQPQKNEVLIKVHASSANAGDWHLLRADPWLVRLMFGLRKPKIKVLGNDVAGVVEAVGPGVTRFAVGDAVFGETSASGFGGYAEYATVGEEYLALVPEGVSFEVAAAVPCAALPALQGLQTHGQLKAGEQVLINGASGGVGSYAVQLAKAMGAEVTGVCSTRNVERVKALGADYVIDYKKEDFTQQGKPYDLILACNGNRRLKEYQRALKPQGRYVHIGGAMRQLFEVMLKGSFKSKKGGQQYRSFHSMPNREDMEALQGYLQRGQIRPVIDKTFPLAEAPRAISYVEQGKVQGKVVVVV